jgi:hypothetical protein
VHGAKNVKFITQIALYPLRSLTQPRGPNTNSAAALTCCVLTIYSGTPIRGLVFELPEISHGLDCITRRLTYEHISVHIKF